MGGSAAEAPTSPDVVRASDAERDEAVDQLKEQFVAGRLSQETFLQRMHSALDARHRGELPPLLADLPHGARRAGLLSRLRAGIGGITAPARDALASAAAAADARYAVGSAIRGMSRGSVVPGRYRAAAPSAPSPGTPAPLLFPRGAGSVFTIGRDIACDMFIGDMTVSRVHAKLERFSGGWLVTDLASTNGTRVNGWRVRDPVPVREGDRVRFGDAEFILQGAEDARGLPQAPGTGSPG
jgi:Domain of unknown function (DUF1707)/FHA domain